MADKKKSQSEREQGPMIGEKRWRFEVREEVSWGGVEGEVVNGRLWWRLRNEKLTAPLQSCFYSFI